MIDLKRSKLWSTKLKLQEGRLKEKEEVRVMADNINAVIDSFWISFVKTRRLTLLLSYNSCILAIPSSSKLTDKDSEFFVRERVKANRIQDLFVIVSKKITRGIYLLTIMVIWYSNLEKLHAVENPLSFLIWTPKSWNLSYCEGQFMFNNDAIRKEIFGNSNLLKQFEVPSIRRLVPKEV